MKRKPSEKLSQIRERQRSHAKKRFLERFDLELNRDRLHEIEKKIASGQVMRIGSKAGRRNYFVEVDGKLVVVGYAPSTQRVVTALPQDYIDKLSSELVTRARFTLLQSAKEQTLAAIAAGHAKLLHETSAARFYEIEFEGLRFKIGCRLADDKLVPYRQRKKAYAGDHPGALQPLSKPVLAPLELSQEIREEIFKQISGGSSIYLWRCSKSVTFHQVAWRGETLRVGYSNTRKALVCYQDPPEDRVELRSSLRLMAEPPQVRDAIAQIVRNGKAELVKKWRNNDRASYQATYENTVIHFDYSKRNDCILPWSGDTVLPWESNSL
jgi:hypothetical protein